MSTGLTGHRTIFKSLAQIRKEVRGNDVDILSLACTLNCCDMYEYGCELFRKRMECAIMIKVAENQELAAQGIEVPIEIGGQCNACATGEACE